MPFSHVGKKTKSKKVKHANFMEMITKHVPAELPSKIKKSVKRDNKKWKQRAKELKGM